MTHPPAPDSSAPDSSARHSPAPDSPAASDCPHMPPCPGADARDAAAARIVAEHLQDCGYALLCNGRLLLEGDGLLDRDDPPAGPGPGGRPVTPPPPPPVRRAA